MGRLNYDSAPARNIPTAAPADSSSAPASTAFVQNAVPAGVVLPYAGPVPPAGWLLCDGSNVSRTTYVKLFAAIGTTYGAGDGSTTFKLPDLRGEFVRGLDQGRGVDAARTLGSVQSGAVEAHAHSTVVQRSTGGSGSAMPVVNNGNNLYAFNANGAASNYNITTGSNTENYGGAETRPRNVAMNYIIKFA